jgi:hypothetical protein
MNRINPDDEPQPFSSDEINELVRNLASVGWLHGTQYVDQEKLSINYSEKGSERMRALVNLAKEFAPEMFKENFRLQRSNSSLKTFGSFAFAIKLIATAPELVGKIKSDGQGNALVGLILAYSRDHGLC